MRLNFTVVVLSVALVGCKTKEFSSTPFYTGDEVKYTGRVEDRINVWPVAYWREPVCSVLWPLVSFSDDHFALRPLYSQYRQSGKDGAFDEFNFLWPLFQADFKEDDHRAFPVFWGWDFKGRGYQTLFPVYWNGPDYNSLFPLWFYGDSGDSGHLSIAFGMAGVSSEKDGHKANWCFPLWYWNSRGTFVTTIYGRWENGWAVPPLLSWGTMEENDDYDYRYLLGLGGTQKYGVGGEMWTLPVFSRKWWQNSSSNLVCKTRLSLNFVGWESNDDEMVSSYVFPLYAWEKDCKLLTTLFYWDKEGSLLTPIGGRVIKGGTTNLFVTPVVKCTSGDKTGGTVFPVWNRETDRDFCAKAGMLDSERLSDDICIWTESMTNMVWSNKCDKLVITTRRRANWVEGHNNTEWLLLFQWHDSVQGHLGYGSHTNTYELVRTITRGTGLFLKYKHQRKATFSAIDRGRESDGEKVDVSFLVWLYKHNREKDLVKNDTCSQHRILWKLWDWEEKNGDISLDVFPGFTYDSKTNGYMNASFFWRLFRYENDPAKGTAVDCLFVPIWR